MAHAVSAIRVGRDNVVEVHFGPPTDQQRLERLEVECAAVREAIHEKERELIAINAMILREIRRQQRLERRRERIAAIDWDRRRRIPVIA
jgi:hypothetical protein